MPIIQNRMRNGHGKRFLRLFRGNGACSWPDEFPASNGAFFPRTASVIKISLSMKSKIDSPKIAKVERRDNELARLAMPRRILSSSAKHSKIRNSSFPYMAKGHGKHPLDREQLSTPFFLLYRRLFLFGILGLLAFPFFRILVFRIQGIAFLLVCLSLLFFGFSLRAAHFYLADPMPGMFRFRFKRL